jgi:hypothetical protein
MTIEDTWNLLEQDTSNIFSGYLTRRILPEVNYDIYLAIEKPSNTRMLMIRVSNAFLDKKTIYPSSSSFVVNRLTLPKDSEKYVTLQLVLTNTRYKDIFTTLVQDIVDNLVPIIEGQLAVLAFITRLQRWQAFLEKHNPEGLSEIAQQGLYGELWFLRQVVIPQLGLFNGLRCWTAPKWTQQDFQFPKCAIEVKTTSAKQHQKLMIASERQLDDFGTGTIVLLHLSLDVRQGSGETLLEMITNIRSLVANDITTRDEFESLLFEIGYLDLHSARYENTSYTIREHNYFKVREGFPRIVESELRNGVGDVRYTISVAECKRFSIPEPEVISMIREEP